MFLNRNIYKQNIPDTGEAYSACKTTRKTDIKTGKEDCVRSEIYGSRFCIQSAFAKAKTVSVVKAKNVKSYIISSTVKIESKIFKVVQVEANSLKAAKIDNVTVGKNVKTLKKNAFAGSKVIKVVLKTKNLKKSQIKGCMSGSKVKKVYVKVGTKAQNKKVLKSYKKFFRKSVIGRKVKIV